MRTISDKLISGIDSLRFSATERVFLYIARMKYEKFYQNKDENPLISVYTPTYNRAKILMERSVPSVLAQTYKNFELIIVGDHCTDDTEELVSKITDPRVRFYNLPKRGYRYPPTAENHWLAGPVVAANRALKMIRGKWIARIDDDDIWTDTHLASLLDFAAAGNCEFASALYEEERRGQRKIIDGEHANGPYFNPIRQLADEGNDLGPKLGGTQTWLYRSYLRFFKYNINCWRKSYNRVNDIDLEIRMYRAGVRMGFLEKVVAYVLPRPGEETVGVEAYRTGGGKTIERFKFEA